MIEQVTEQRNGWTKPLIDYNIEYCIELSATINLKFSSILAVQIKEHPINRPFFFRTLVCSFNNLVTKSSASSSDKPNPPHQKPRSLIITSILTPPINNLKLQKRKPPVHQHETVSTRNSGTPNSQSVHRTEHHHSQETLLTPAIWHSRSTI